MFNSTATLIQTARYTTTQFEVANSADANEILQLENEIHLYDIQYLIQDQQIRLAPGGIWSFSPISSNETGYIVAAVSASTSHNTLINCYWADNFVNSQDIAFNETVNVGNNGVAHFPFVGFAPGSSGPNSIRINFLNGGNSSMTADVNVLLVY
jgi:hypothetical protein